MYAGLSDNTTESTSGNFPGVALWDADGGLIGFEDGTSSKIKDGTSGDIQVSSDGRSAEYIGVSNGGSDGLCISSLAITMSNGDQLGWFGDVGMACGAPWYHSKEILGNDDYRPVCVWIDRDGSNGHPYQGMSIHLPDFLSTKARASQYQNQPGTMCKNLPRFTMWRTFMTYDTITVFDSPPIYNEDGSDASINAILNPKTRLADPVAWDNAAGLASGPSALEIQTVQPSTRRTKQRRQISTTMQNQLIVSSIDSHTATSLCQSDTSSGPDFVSTIEGLYCDMSEKQLYQLCSNGTITDNCFDMTTNTILAASGNVSSGNWTMTGAHTAIAGSALPQKSYAQVLNWD